jgi:FSR family fosmidomycin resistance protein-like MFS transporter
LNQDSVATVGTGLGKADQASTTPVSGRVETRTVTTILLAVSFSHLLNDTIQSLFPAIYPFLKTSFELSYTQIGLITLTFQLTASLLQPVVGYYT